MKLKLPIHGVLLAACTLATAMATPNAVPTDFAARGVNYNGTGNALPYRLFIPDGYNDPANVSRQYPIVLFMHGLGERGTDNLNQVSQSGAPVLGLVTGSNRDNFPAFVVCPQIPGSTEWGWGDHTTGTPYETRRIIELLRTEFRIDASRIYATGLSLGAIGTFSQLKHFPGYYAAAIPMAYNGPTDAPTVANYALTPMWVFYGFNDPMKGSPSWNDPRVNVDLTRAAGGYVLHTEYPTGAHGTSTWGTANNGRGLYTVGLMQWLCSQQTGVVSTEAPRVAWTTPGAGPTYGTSAATINIGGSATDAMGAGASRTITSVAWKNTNTAGTTLGSGTAAGTTTWSASSIALSSGVNKIQVIATDNNDTTFNRMLTVTRSGDTVVPAVTITSPTSAATHPTSSPAITLGGSASDAVGVTSVTWTNNRGGSGTAAGTTSWSIANIALQSGANIITVTASDAASNTATDVITVTYSAPPTNQAPVVNAGSDQSVTLPSAVSLAGTVTDDGLSPGSASPTVTWSNPSGPGTVTFTNVNAAVTSATFSVAGTYVLRLTGSDGALSASDDMTVIAQPAASSTGWVNQDIGTVAFTGSMSESGGTYTINGSGTSFTGNTDQFHYAWQPAAGDCTIVARVGSLTGGHAWDTRGGVMIRESLNTASKHAFMGVTKGMNTLFVAHENTNDNWSYSTYGPNTEIAPYWVKVTRVGNLFSGYKSTDGTNWTFVNSRTIVMSSPTIYVGMAVNAATASQIATVTFTNVSATGTTTWTSEDIGTVGIAGTASESGGTFTLTGSGDGFFANNDQFQYVHRDANGDCTIIARVASLTGGHAWSARAGVMIRENLTSASKHVFMGITKGQGTGYVSHASASDTWTTAQWGVASEQAPYWVKLTRVGNVFTGYKSTDGINWTSVMNTTVAMTGPTYIGLTTSSAANTQLSTAAFTGVSVTP